MYGLIFIAHLRENDVLSTWGEKLKATVVCEDNSLIPKMCGKESTYG